MNPGYKLCSGHLDPPKIEFIPNDDRIVVSYCGVCVVCGVRACVCVCQHASIWRRRKLLFPHYHVPRRLVVEGAPIQHELLLPEKKN